MSELETLKLQRIALLEKQVRWKKWLPHLYALPHYKWSREFYECRHKESYMTAANQIGKSTSQIRRWINWAVDKSLWPELWPGPLSLGKSPNLFWYLYPDSKTFDTEWETKWVPLLPKREGMEDPEFWAIYGWETIRSQGQIRGVRFSSGVRGEFRFYSQDTANLQAGTVYYIAFDEELPIQHLTELEFRLSDTNGYMSGVFTATLGQKFWWDVMEGVGEEEKKADAWKKQVSLYDCQEFEDGTKTKWTDSEISRAKQRCATEADIQRRIYGKFASAGNLKYESFDKVRNTVSPVVIPPSWKIYAGVDVGSGKGSHKAAISFIAVNPEYTQGRIFLAWRGDHVRTTAGDVLTKYRTMKMQLELKGYRIESAAYDWAAKDFFTIATSYGEAFQRAIKDRDAGEMTGNALFKNGMLLLHNDDPEIEKLVSEILSTTNKSDTSHNEDDLLDATRYAWMLIPWDWTALEQGRLEALEAKLPEATPALTSAEDRAAFYRQTGPYARGGQDEQQDELDFWGEMFEQ